MKKIVIIPARGGSKRIPRKNIKDFLGKPIITYSLQSSVESGIFDHIHVSTEDKEIYEIVSNLGFTPEFYRTEKCADDHTPVRNVLIEVVQKFEEQGYQYDIICLLSATAPLIDGNDLRKAYLEFEKSSMIYPMIAVTRYPVPIEWALKLNTKENIVEPFSNDLFFESSHNFQDTYYDVGSFAFFTRENLFSKGSEIKFAPYMLPQEKSVDLDNLEDWHTLERLYTAQNLSMPSLR